MAEDGSTRLKAIEDLIAFYRGKYDKNEFIFNDKVKFCYAEDRGIHLKAIEDIAPNETIIKLPEAERICYSTISNPSLEVDTNYDLSNILDAIVTTCCNLQFQEEFEVEVMPRSISLNMLVLYLLSNESRFSNVVATWPSRKDLEDVFGKDSQDLKWTFAGYMRPHTLKMTRASSA